MRKFFCVALALLLLLSCAALAQSAEAPVEEAPVEQETPAEEVPAEEEAPAEEEPGWFATFIEKILEMKWYTVVILVLLLFFALVLTVGAKNAKWDARVLAHAAVCLAVSFVLASLRLFRMVNGGSITPVSMLPLILFALAYGPVRGFVVGCAFGLLNLIQDPWVIHPIQLLLDYPFAYAALVLCCLSKHIKLAPRWQMVLAVPLGYFGRFVIAVLSGVVFFADAAGPEGALLYSMGYNASYLAPEAIAGVLLMMIPGMARLPEMMRGRKASS